MTLNQLQLIKRAIELSALKHAIPKFSAVTKLSLGKSAEGKYRERGRFHFKLATFLTKLLGGYRRLGAPMSTHKVTKVLTNPKVCHDPTEKMISKYFL